MMISCIVSIGVLAWVIGCFARWIFGWTMKFSLVVSGAIALGLALSYKASNETGTFGIGSIGSVILGIIIIWLIYKIIKWLLTKSRLASFIKKAVKALTWPQRGLVIAIAVVTIVILLVII